jgi:hypothetical protein
VQRRLQSCDVQYLADTVYGKHGSRIFVVFQLHIVQYSNQPMSPEKALSYGVQHIDMLCLFRVQFVNSGPCAGQGAGAGGSPGASASAAPGGSTQAPGSAAGTPSVSRRGPLPLSARLATAGASGGVAAGTAAEAWKGAAASPSGAGATACPSSALPPRPAQPGALKEQAQRGALAAGAGAGAGASMGGEGGPARAGRSAPAVTTQAGARAGAASAGRSAPAASTQAAAETTGAPSNPQQVTGAVTTGALPKLQQGERLLDLADLLRKSREEEEGGGEGSIMGELAELSRRTAAVRKARAQSGGAAGGGKK